VCVVLGPLDFSKICIVAFVCQGGQNQHFVERAQFGVAFAFANSTERNSRLLANPLFLAAVALLHCTIVFEASFLCRFLFAFF
jgi:hypothetical protein